MPSTSRFGWIYPSEGQTNWMEIYKSFVNQQDADVYASFENPNLILRGGGVVSLVADTLSWTEDFEILSMLTGGLITIEAGSLSGFEDGKIAYLTISRPVNGSRTLTLSVTDVLDTDDSKLFFAVRRGSSVYFRNHANRNAISTFDKTGSNKITTSTVTASGGTVSGSFQTGIVDGISWYLGVTALGNTVDSTIQFFSDASETEEIYSAANKDCYTSAYEDRYSWYLLSDSSGLVYYKITNDGANDSVYEMEISGMGKAS